MPFRLETTMTGGWRLTGHNSQVEATAEWDAQGRLIQSSIAPTAPRTPADQPPVVASAPEQPRPLSPCALLKAVIHKISGEAPCDLCIQRCRALDERGWWWAWRNRRVIAGWLCESAKRRADQMEQAAQEMTRRARAAREAADALDPDRTLTLLVAAWRELRRGSSRGRGEAGGGVERAIAEG
ncbi:MAG TPA: hypothetical protein VF184_03185 [Phycisphaeraceae bacterium]